MAIICSDGSGDGPGIPSFGDPFGNFWNASRNFGDDLARRVGDWWNWLTGGDKPHDPPIMRTDRETVEQAKAGGRTLTMVITGYRDRLRSQIEGT